MWELGVSFNIGDPFQTSIMKNYDLVILCEQDIKFHEVRRIESGYNRLDCILNKNTTKSTMRDNFRRKAFWFSLQFRTTAHLE